MDLSKIMEGFAEFVVANKRMPSTIYLNKKTFNSLKKNHKNRMDVNCTSFHGLTIKIHRGGIAFA